LAHKTLVSDFRHIDTRLARILLIEAAPRILGAFPESLTHKTKQKLVSMGVEVRTEAPVAAVDEHGVVVAGERINASTIIWSAGVSASSAGTWLDAEVDRAGRVKVASDLSVPGHPNVFVIGDTASIMQEGKALPGVAQVAMQGGSYVASVIIGRVEGKAMNKPFSYRDKGNLATVGRSYAIVDINNIRLTGFLAWLIWLAVHIYFLVGFRNRLVTIFQWAWTYFTFDRGARLITFENEREP
jgi:NADH dehydrogenase